MGKKIFQDIILDSQKQGGGGSNLDLHCPHHIDIVE